MSPDECYGAGANQAVDCSVGTSSREALSGTEDFPVNTLHYLKFSFGEGPYLCTVEENGETEGGIDSVGSDGVETTKTRTNSVQCEEGTSGC